MATNEEERSPGGSQILRHEPGQRDWTPPPRESSAGELEQFLARHFGEPATVFHEIVSDLIHIDVHAIPPTPGRQWWTLFTTGMSDLPMTVPPSAEEFRFAELLIKLPASWDVESLRVIPPPPGADRWYWPIRELKKMARLPHEYSTWLGFGHTVPNGDPPVSFASDTALCGWLLLPPLGVPPEVRAMGLSSGVVVHLYALHALHRDEMELKLNKGTNALLDLFDKDDVSEVLDPHRPSVVKKSGPGRFWR